MTQATSVLYYPGGKTRLVRRLTQFLPSSPSSGVLVSPFFGGGSFELHVARTRGWRVIANDADWRVHNFWKTAQDPERRAELVRLADLAWQLPFDVVTKAAMLPQGALDPINAAAYYWVKGRRSVNGHVYGGGESKQRSQQTLRSAIQALERDAPTLAEHVTLFNLDYRVFLREAFLQIDALPTANVVVFLDPPYEIKHKRLYAGHATFSHDELHRFLQDDDDVMRDRDWILCGSKTADRMRRDFGECYEVQNGRQTELVAVRYTASASSCSVLAREE